MNLREANDDKGFPPRDHIPAGMLTENFESEEVYTQTCHAFFVAIFTHLQEELYKDNSKDFIKKWNDHMTTMGEPHCEDQRTEFFQDVEKTYKNVSLH